MTDEPADPDAMWESFRRFAEAKGLPPPPEDQASLPKVRSEDAEAIFQGGDGEGLDDPRLRYLYAALPEFGKTHVPHEEMIPAGAIVQVRPSQGSATAPFTGMTEAATSGAAHGAARPLKHLDGGAWAGAAPNSMDAGDAEAGSSPAPSTDGELAPYHAQVLDLPMFLASEDPADTSAHEYTFVPHLQRFDRLSGFDAALPEAPAALQQSYSLREFVRRFYPHVAAEVIDMFDASANSNVWLVAVALAPDGAALLQQIPKSWVRVLPAHALPLQAAAGLVEACAGAPSSDLSTAGEAQQISTIERPLRSSMDARGTPPGPGAAGSEQQRPGRGPMPEASGNRNVTGAREHGAGRAAGLAERMQALFKAAREGNMSQVVGLISRQGASPYWKDVANDDMQPMHIAAAHGHARVCEAIQQLATEQAGSSACLALRDGRGRAPLHCAAMAGEVDAARVLLEYAPQGHVDARDELERTALHYAAACILGRDTQAGGVVDVRDHKLQTPLHVAADMGNGQACAVLLEHGADTEAKDYQGRRPADLAWSSAAARALGSSPVDVSELKDMWADLSEGQRRAAADRRRCQGEQLKKALNDLEDRVDMSEGAVPQDTAADG